MVETAAAVATVPVRVMGLLGQAELLVSRITMVAENAEALVERVGATAEEAEQAVREIKVTAAAAALIVEEASTVAAAASLVVAEAESVATGAARVIGGAAAATDAATHRHHRRGRPHRRGDRAGRRVRTRRRPRPRRCCTRTATRCARPLRWPPQFVDELSPEEITAAIKMVDTFPALREHLIDDVLPLLGKLDQVGPDLHKLLEVTEDLRLAIAGLPGLKMLRRRGEDRVEEESPQRALSATAALR